MGGGKTAAEVAAEGMRRHAEYRAEMSAYKATKAAQREAEKRKAAPKRWLHQRDISD